MALPTLNLSFQFGDISYIARHRIALPRHKVARWIRHSLSHDGEITVRIVDAEEGQRLNREFRKKDYATNVLTFDYMQSPVVMADLVLCAPVVAQEAREQGSPDDASARRDLVRRRPVTVVVPGKNSVM